MIDLHCHILPSLDDGAGDLIESLAMARAAVASGIQTVVATPHVREDYPFDPALIALRADELNDSLVRERISLRVVAGAELAISRVADLDPAALASVALGNGPYVLVESPYTVTGDLLENALFDLQLHGLRPVLAHPERSPCFVDDPERLRALVGHGVLCSITAASMAGRFGQTVRRFTMGLLREGLVHNIASDAHDAGRRGPELRVPFERAAPELPGIRAYADWLTVAVPRAMLAGGELPPAPEPPRPRRTPWRNVLRR